MKYTGIASISVEIEPDLSALISLYAKFKVIIFGICKNPKCYDTVERDTNRKRGRR